LRIYSKEPILQLPLPAIEKPRQTRENRRRLPGFAPPTATISIDKSRVTVENCAAGFTAVSWARANCWGQYLRSAAVDSPFLRPAKETEKLNAEGQ
jgi:hypothetical protein